MEKLINTREGYSQTIKDRAWEVVERIVKYNPRLFRIGLVFFAMHSSADLASAQAVKPTIPSGECLVRIVLRNHYFAEGNNKPGYQEGEDLNLGPVAEGRSFSVRNTPGNKSTIARTNQDGLALDLTTGSGYIQLTGPKNSRRNNKDATEITFQDLENGDSNKEPFACGEQRGYTIMTEAGLRASKITPRPTQPVSGTPSTRIAAPTRPARDIPSPESKPAVVTPTVGRQLTPEFPGTRTPGPDTLRTPNPTASAETVLLTTPTPELKTPPRTITPVAAIATPTTRTGEGGPITNWLRGIGIEPVFAAAGAAFLVAAGLFTERGRGIFRFICNNLILAPLSFILGRGVGLGARAVIWGGPRVFQGIRRGLPAIGRLFRRRPAGGAGGAGHGGGPAGP